MVAHYAYDRTVFGCGPFTRIPKETVEAMVDIFMQGMSTEGKQMKARNSYLL